MITLISWISFSFKSLQFPPCTTACHFNLIFHRLFHRGRYDSACDFHTEGHQNPTESILGQDLGEYVRDSYGAPCTGSLVHALMVPTHVDYPFLSAFCELSRIRVRDVSNPFVSARDMTSFNFMCKECFAAGRMEEANAMRVSRVNIGCADNSQEPSPCRHGCTVARMRKHCRNHNAALAKVFTKRTRVRPLPLARRLSHFTLFLVNHQALS